MMRRGLIFSSASGPRPQPSMAPGRKFSISTSTSPASCRTMSCARGSFRSRASERLLRDCTCHQTEVPSFSKRHLRSGSPMPGGSILITSAPKSAKVLAANGPAISWPSSSTFRPLSGPVGASVEKEEFFMEAKCAFGRPGRPLLCLNFGLRVLRRLAQKGEQALDGRVIGAHANAGGHHQPAPSPGLGQRP